MDRDNAYKILKKHLPGVRAYNGNSGEDKIIDAMIEFAESKEYQCMSCERMIPKNEQLIYCSECVK